MRLGKYSLQSASPSGQTFKEVAVQGGTQDRTQDNTPEWRQDQQRRNGFWQSSYHRYHGQRASAVSEHGQYFAKQCEGRESLLFLKTKTKQTALVTSAVPFSWTVRWSEPGLTPCFPFFEGLLTPLSDNDGQHHTQCPEVAAWALTVYPDMAPDPYPLPLTINKVGWH